MCLQGEALPTACLPYDLPPPENDTFVDRAREHLAMTGVGRHPALGAGLMTNQELADKILREEPTSKTPRHDECSYDGKWGEPTVGYWTLGACEVTLPFPIRACICSPVAMCGWVVRHISNVRGALAW